MSERINTVDVIGEQELCAALIEKDFSSFSVTEYYDDRVEMIGAYALATLSVDRVALPSVTGDVSLGAFYYCKALTVDLGAPNMLGQMSFERASVTSLIIRGENVPTLYNANVFKWTPIASGTGYIYVPSALVDSYKAATNWSTHAAQIRAIEDYPEITGG